jgi:hypothetical protein
LRNLSPFIAKKSLTFNYRIKAIKLIIDVIFVDNFPHKKIILLNFTVFSFIFTEIFENSILEFINVIDMKGQLILIFANSGISVFKLSQNIIVKKFEDLLKSFD